MRDTLALGMAHVMACEWEKYEFEGVLLFHSFIFFIINPVDARQIATMSLLETTHRHTHADRQRRTLKKPNTTICD